MSIHALSRIEDACRALAIQDRYRIDSNAVSGLPKCGLDVKELAAYLGHRNTSNASRDAVWRYVIDRAGRLDSNWALIATKLATPGIRRAISRARYIIPGYDQGELETEAVYAFTEALNAIQVNQKNLCSKLCQRVSSHLRTFLREQLRDIKVANRIEFESCTPSPPSGHVDFVLAQAVREQIITQCEALMISAVRMDKADIRCMADEQRVPMVELKLKFKVAEERLVQWIIKK